MNLVTEPKEQLKHIMDTHANSIQANILHLEHQLSLKSELRIIDDTDEELEEQLKLLRKERLITGRAIQLLVDKDLYK